MAEEEELPKWGKLVAGQKSTDSSKKHYSSFILDHVEYFLYDFVFLKSEEEEPYIAMILDLWDDGTSMEMRIRWMWRPSDIPLDIDIDRSLSNKELFLATGPGTGVEDDNDVCTVVGKCTNIFCSLTEMDQQSLQTCRQEADFFFYRAYNHEERKIYPSLDEVVGELGVNKICSSVAKVLPTQDACIIMNRQQKNLCGTTNSLLLKTGDQSSNKLACKEMVRTISEKLVKQIGVPRKRTKNDDVCKIKKRVKFSFTNSSADVETHNEIAAIQFEGPKLDAYDRSDTKSRNLGSVRCSHVSNHEITAGNYSGKETIPPENRNHKSRTNPEVEMLDVDFVLKANVMEAKSNNVAGDKVISSEREVKLKGVDVAPYELVNCRLGISKLNGVQMDMKKGPKKLNLTLQVDVNTRDTMFIGSHPSGRIRVNLDEAPSSTLLASKVKMTMPMVLKKGTNEPLSSMVDNPIQPVKESCSSALVDAPKGKKRELFKKMTWEETLEEGFLTGKVLLFQNLDPCWTSEDIKDAIHVIFPKVVCRVSSVGRRCSLYCSEQQSGDSVLALGQALIVFKERHTGDKILNIFQQRCLVLSNDGRPCLVTPVERPLTKAARFPGHLDLEKYKCSRAYQAKVKMALSTAHCAQQNTAEFEMASRWRMLSEQHNIQWKDLLKMQELEMQKLMSMK